MYSCKDFCSLSVLSLFEGELVGVVDKLYFDKKLKKLMELELIGEDGVRLTLPSKNIYHVGKNAITIKNNQCVSVKVDKSDFVPCPVQSKAFSINGEFLGVVKELSFNDKFFTEKIVLDNEAVLSSTDLASFGKNTIVFYDKSAKIDVKKFNPEKAISNGKVIENDHVQQSQPDQPKTEKQQNIKVQSAEFLLGRICTKDIFNFNNELLIKAHSVVNKKNLKEINKFGKLRELMLFTK